MVYYKTKYSAKGSSLSSLNYRFGYQGSEKDNEVNSSNGTSYATEFRQLDTRLGRWFSSDPVFQPWQSSYTSMDNNPINLTDVLGDDPTEGGKYEVKKYDPKTDKDKKYYIDRNGTRWIRTPVQQKQEETKANKHNLEEKKSSELNGDLGVDYGFASEGQINSSLEGEIKGFSETDGKKIVWCEDCTGTDGKKGHYMWQQGRLEVSEIVLNDESKDKSSNQREQVLLSKPQKINGGFEPDRDDPTTRTRLAIVTTKNSMVTPKPKQTNTYGITNTVNKQVNVVLLNGNYEITSIENSYKKITYKTSNISYSSSVGIAFGTTRSLDDNFTTNLFETRFNFMSNSVGNTANLIRLENLDESLVRSQMMGKVNQVKIYKVVTQFSVDITQETNITTTQIQTKKWKFK